MVNINFAELANSANISPTGPTFKPAPIRGIYAGAWAICDRNLLREQLFRNVESAHDGLAEAAFLAPLALFANMILNVRFNRAAPPAQPTATNTAAYQPGVIHVTVRNFSHDLMMRYNAVSAMSSKHLNTTIANMLVAESPLSRMLVEINANLPRPYPHFNWANQEAVSRFLFTGWAPTQPGAQIDTLRTAWESTMYPTPLAFEHWNIESIMRTIIGKSQLGAGRPFVDASLYSHIDVRNTLILALNTLAEWTLSDEPWVLLNCNVPQDQRPQFRTMLWNDLLTYYSMLISYIEVTSSADKYNAAFPPFTGSGIDQPLVARLKYVLRLLASAYNKHAFTGHKFNLKIYELIMKDTWSAFSPLLDDAYFTASYGVSGWNKIEEKRKVFHDTVDTLTPKWIDHLTTTLWSEFKTVMGVDYFVDHNVLNTQLEIFDPTASNGMGNYVLKDIVPAPPAVDYRFSSTSATPRMYRNEYAAYNGTTRRNWIQLSSWRTHFLNIFAPFLNANYLFAENILTTDNYVEEYCHLTPQDYIPGTDLSMDGIAFTGQEVTAAMQPADMTTVTFMPLQPRRFLPVQAGSFVKSEPLVKRYLYVPIYAYTPAIEAIELNRMLPLATFPYCREIKWGLTHYADFDFNLMPFAYMSHVARDPFDNNIQNFLVKFDTLKGFWGSPQNGFQQMINVIRANPQDARSIVTPLAANLFIYTSDENINNAHLSQGGTPPAQFRNRGSDARYHLAGTNRLTPILPLCPTIYGAWTGNFIYHNAPVVCAANEANTALRNMALIHYVDVGGNTEYVVNPNASSFDRERVWISPDRRWVIVLHKYLPSPSTYKTFYGYNSHNYFYAFNLNECHLRRLYHAPFLRGADWLSSGGLPTNPTQFANEVLPQTPINPSLCTDFHIWRRLYSSLGMRAIVTFLQDVDFIPDPNNPSSQPYNGQLRWVTNRHLTEYQGAHLHMGIAEKAIYPESLYLPMFTQMGTTSNDHIWVKHHVDQEKAGRRLIFSTVIDRRVIMLDYTDYKKAMDEAPIPERYVLAPWVQKMNTSPDLEKHALDVLADLAVDNGNPRETHKLREIAVTQGAASHTTAQIGIDGNPVLTSGSPNRPVLTTQPSNLQSEVTNPQGGTSTIVTPGSVTTESTDPFAVANSAAENLGNVIPQ